jgi:hypothetical protein
MEERKTRKLQIELDEHTFSLLEVLAYGLFLEENENGDELPECPAFDKNRNDFGPGVRKLLEQVAGSMATGVRRPGAWEREVVDSLTGWQGTFNRGMFADCIKDELKQEELQ